MAGELNRRINFRDNGIGDFSVTDRFVVVEGYDHGSGLPKNSTSSCPVALLPSSMSVLWQTNQAIIFD